MRLFLVVGGDGTDRESDVLGVFSERPRAEAYVAEREKADSGWQEILVMTLDQPESWEFGTAGKE